LDYYTGIIFEVILRNDRSLGTICAGGRYANLCSMFSKQQFSGVGVAFGFERLVEALEARGQLAEARLATQVLVVNFGGELAGSALSIARKLRQAGVSTEFYFDEAKLPKQFKYADKKGIPWVVICGEDEVKKGTVVLKDMRTGEQEELKQEQLVERMQ
jgi:histidyl-tRNA synthetase